MTSLRFDFIVSVIGGGALQARCSAGKMQPSRLTVLLLPLNSRELPLPPPHRSRVTEARPLVPPVGDRWNVEPDDAAAEATRQLPGR